MLVEVPHGIHEYVEDLEFAEREQAGLTKISYIFLAKHQSDDKLDRFMYIYNDGRTVLRSFSDMTAMLSKLRSLLELKSIPWDGSFAMNTVTLGSYLKNPIEELKLRVLNEPLNITRFNYYICNWTQNSITTINKGAFNKGDTLKCFGHFSPLKDYKVMTDNWREFTLDDYRRYYGDYNLRNPVDITYTDDRTVTTKNPMGNFYDDTEKKSELKAIFQSKSKIVNEYSSNEVSPSSYDSRTSKTARRELVMLHLCFKKLKKMTLEMLVLIHTMPTPKYMPGSVLESNYINEIYMYLDLDLSWNIKYLCTSLEDIRDPRVEVIQAYYLKQKELRVAFPVENDTIETDIKKGQTKRIYIENSIFDDDVSIYRHNKAADKCSKNHFKFKYRCPVYNCRQRVNFSGIKCKYHSKENPWKIKCHRKWCKGPKKVDPKEIVKQFTVIRIKKMTTDVISQYEMNNIVNKKRTMNGTFTDKSSVSIQVSPVPDTVAFTWQYTKDVV